VVREENADRHPVEIVEAAKEMNVGGATTA